MPTNVNTSCDESEERAAPQSPQRLSENGKLATGAYVPELLAVGRRQVLCSALQSQGAAEVRQQVGSRWAGDVTGGCAKGGRANGVLESSVRHNFVAQYQNRAVCNIVL